MKITWLGALNFLVLQWFGVRLGCGYDPGEIPGRQSGPISDVEAAALGGRWWSRYAPPRGVRVRWVWLRWIWPLTGWWSDFRWIARRS